MGAEGPLDSLGPAELRLVVSTYRDILRSHQDLINRLNVFPVPDGDTGTNMALTVESVLGELDGVDADMASTCKAINHGSLMGARGNSGVILSQILRGLCGVFVDVERIDSAVFGEALRSSAEAAYEAVMKPQEGTILTVVRESSEAATTAEGNGDGLAKVVEAALGEAAASLDRTPDLLPVLAEAGVVDAGGKGYCLLLNAFSHVVDGTDLPEPDESIEGDVEGLAGFESLQTDEPKHGDEVTENRYEVMYFLEAPDGEVDGFKEAWSEIGDSIVVVGGDGLFNCHIHTDDIGESIEAAIRIGTPRNIRITDLKEQVEEEQWVRDAEGAGVVIENAPEVGTAVVAVATGEGIIRIFRSLGVQGLVAGGQSMNPSTAQLLDIVERVNGPEVVILPNNKNIIPVAEQVNEESDKQVLVVPTRSITEGFASLLEYDPEASAAENVEGMKIAAEAVASGELCQAVRDSTCDLGPIREGEWMGIASGDIRSLDDDIVQAATSLLDDLLTGEREVVTIMEGADAEVADTRAISEWLEERHPDISVEIHDGGQPLYPYLLGIE